MKNKLFYILLLLLLSVVKLHAQSVLNVNQGTSHTTLQDAVNTANDGDELKLSVNTIYNEEVVVEGKSLTLTANQTSSNYTYEQITVKGITMNGIGKTLTISAHIGISRVLDMHKGNVVVTSGYNFVLRSTPTGTALVINNDPTNTVQGNVIMERYISQGISGLSYRYFSSPFADATISQFADDMNLILNTTYNTASEPAFVRPYPTFFHYVETNAGFIRGSYYNEFISNWRVPTFILLYPVKGYQAMISTGSVIDLNGTLNNGNFNANLTNSGGTALININLDGFNNLGNPYPSPIDWDRVVANINNVNVNNSIYLEKAANQYQGNFGVYTNGISYGGGKSQIASMQGFFVQANSSIGNLEFTNENRMTIYEDVDVSYLRVSENSLPKSGFIEIALQTDKIVDQTSISFQEGASSDFDKKYDVIKMDSKNSTIYSYNEINENEQPKYYSINGLSNNGLIEKIYLGIDIKAEGEHQIILQTMEYFSSDYNLYLYDSITDSLHNFEEGSYKFQSKEGKEIKRFVLVLKAEDNKFLLNKNGEIMHPFPYDMKKD